MARMSKKDRIAWLEKQIDIQNEALVRAKTMNDANIHSYLLQRLTNEWCKLIGKEVR